MEEDFFVEFPGFGLDSVTELFEDSSVGNATPRLLLGSNKYELFNEAEMSRFELNQLVGLFKNNITVLLMPMEEFGQGHLDGVILKKGYLHKLDHYGMRFRVIGMGPWFIRARGGPFIFKVKGGNYQEFVPERANFVIIGYGSATFTIQCKWSNQKTFVELHA